MSSERTYFLRCDTDGCANVFVPRKPEPDESYPRLVTEVRVAARRNGWGNSFVLTIGPKGQVNGHMADYCVACVAERDLRASEEKEGTHGVQE